MKLHFRGGASSTSENRTSEQRGSQARTSDPGSSATRSLTGFLSNLTRIGRSSRSSSGQARQTSGGHASAQPSPSTPNVAPPGSVDEQDEPLQATVARIVSQKSLYRHGSASGTSDAAVPTPTLAHFIAPSIGVPSNPPPRRSGRGLSRLWRRKPSASAQASAAPSLPPSSQTRREQHAETPQETLRTSTPSEEPETQDANAPSTSAHPDVSVSAPAQEHGSDVETVPAHATEQQKTAADPSSSTGTQAFDQGPIFDESDSENEDDLIELDLELGRAISTVQQGEQGATPEITLASPSGSPAHASQRNESSAHGASTVTVTAPPPEPDPTPNAAPRQSLGKLKQLKETIKGWHTYAKDEAYIHGFGISSTSLSLTPLATDTHTARAKPFTGVVHEGDAPIEPHNRLKDMPGGTPPAVLHESPIVNALEDPHALDKMFLDESFLPGTERRQLIDSIKTIAENKNLTPLETTSLAQALHIAFGRSPDRARDTAYDPAYDAAHDARVALRSLPETNLLDALRDNAAPPRAPDYDADRAWALAQELVHIPGGVGASLLDKLTPKTERPAGTHPSVIEKDRILAGVLLKASQQAVREARFSAEPKTEGKILGLFSRQSRQVGNAASPTPNGPRMLAHDPASIFADGALHAAIAEAGEGNWPGRGNTAVPSNLTLAQKAMLAVKEELQEIDAHVAHDATRGAAFTKGTHGCRFAISMIRGDMLTDESRAPDGTRSQFGRTEARLGKSVGKHLDRAMRRPRTWTQFMGSLEALGRHVGVYKNKSPFYTYNRIAESDGGRGMDVGNRGGTHAGRAFRDMMDQVHGAIDARETLVGDAAIGDDQALKLLVRASLMQTTKEETGPLPRFAIPSALSTLSQEKVVTAVATKLSAAGIEPDDAMRAKIAATVAEENQPLTAQRLQQWATDVGGPASHEALQDILTTQAADHPWRAFAQAFQHAENPGNVPPIETPSLRGKSREEVADILAKIVAAEELGSGFAFDSAGNVQGTTKNVSGIISSIPLHLLGSVHVDLGGGKIRTVRFESVTSTDRSQLRVSVTTLKRGQAGLGGSVGHFSGHEHPITLSAGIDGGGAYEVVHQEGAVLGFPRNLSGGVMGDRAVNEKKGQLVKLLVLGGELEGLARPANEEDRKSLIKCAYQAFGDDLSIGFYEMNQTDKQGTISVNGSVGIRFDHFKLATPTLGAGAKAQSATIRYQDQSGFLKTEWETDSTNYNASFQGSLAGLSGYDELPGRTHELSNSAITSVAPFLSGSAQFFRFGVADRRVQILQDNKELPTSFATRTFQAPISFLHEFGQNVDKYAEEKAKQYFAKEYNAGGASRENVVAREKTRMIEFVNHYLKQRDLTATPQLYTEFGGNVETANKLRAAAYMAERLGKKDTAQAARQEIDAIHGDQKYREGRFLTSLQIEQEGQQVGLNGIAGVTYARNDNRAQQVLTFT